MSIHRPLTHHEQATMVFVRRCVVVAMWIVALASGACRFPGVDQHEKRYPQQGSWQPVTNAYVMPHPWAKPMPLPQAVPMMEPKPAKQVGLAWDNAQPEWVGRAVTGIVASTDLIHWSEVFLTNYTVGTTVCWLSNRPASEFYRALNRAN